MKKIVVLAVAVIMAASLSACAFPAGKDAGSLTIIGGSDGPTSIYLGPGSGKTEASLETGTELSEESESSTEEYTDEYFETEIESEESESDESETEEIKTYTKADLKSLKNTEIFLPTTIEHIFIGTINKKGNATGYHYEGIEDSAGEVIEGTRTEPDSFGVYSGKVRVNGIKKSGNKGYSTFYPEDMSPQEVIDAINEAYESRELLNGNLYAGLTDDGMEIDMALTDDDKIITAYPVMED